MQLSIIAYYDLMKYDLAGNRQDRNIDDDTEMVPCDPNSPRAEMFVILRLDNWGGDETIEWNANEWEVGGNSSYRAALIDLLQRFPEADFSVRLYDGVWQRVVYLHETWQMAPDDEALCPACGKEFADCPCPGPMQDEEFEYKLLPLEFGVPHELHVFARKLE